MVLSLMEPKHVVLSLEMFPNSKGAWRQFLFVSLVKVTAAKSQCFAETHQKKKKGRDEQFLNPSPSRTIYDILDEG